MPGVASTWSVRGREMDLTAGVLVGVLNVTPDSFSDGGDHLDPQQAITAGIRMSEQGAGLVDVGGESTRPGAPEVPADEELRRVMPVVRGLVGAGVAVSIDTSKPEVAAAALEAGAMVVNDVRAAAAPGMIDLLSSTGAGVILMHMKGTPRTMQDHPHYDDVVSEVGAFLAERAGALEEAGVSPGAIAIDPGIGFGKTVGHNLALLDRLGELASRGRPLVLGTSRKSFLGAVTGVSDPRERDLSTSVTTALGFIRGARIFRVHDVVGSRDALRLAAAIVAGEQWHEWSQGSSPEVSPG